MNIVLFMQKVVFCLIEYIFVAMLDSCSLENESKNNSERLNNFSGSKLEPMLNLDFSAEIRYLIDLQE